MTETQEINSLLIELHYFPCVSYFKLLSAYEKVFLEAEEHFIKQTYRNRTYILTSNKIDRLSIPIIHEDKKKPIRLLSIDYKLKWQLRHWRAIQSAYAKAPFFEYYADFFEKEIFRICLGWSCLQPRVHHWYIINAKKWILYHCLGGYCRSFNNHAYLFH